MNSDKFQETQFNIRDKLENLRRLFEDEDEAEVEDGKRNNRNGNALRSNKNQASSDWDLTSHKIMYQEAMDRRKRIVER